MARLGAFCFPGTGHIHPMTALARRLEQRGHQVVIFGVADTELRVRAAKIDFHRIGEMDYPPGTLPDLDRRLGELKGFATFRFTVERVRNMARMVLRDGPPAARAESLDAVLVDEADMGGSVAEHLGLPFVSIALFPPLVQDDRIPPFVFGWRCGQHWWHRLRNRLGFRLLSQVARPILAEVNQQRRSWGLPPLRRSTDALSPLAQVTQLPEVLEFPCEPRPPKLFYTGPFVDGQQRPTVEFPWERLDGRPLVYASLGTLQNGSEEIFRVIAQACAGLPAQLVLSLGGGLDPERLQSLPGDPVVVCFASQLEILKRAAAVITHAGLNTVLESLSEGVPMVALPLGNDQPGVAARVAHCGAGRVIARRTLTPAKLRVAVQAVLEDDTYRRAAQRIQSEIRKIDGLERAAQIIEQLLADARKPLA